jgi:hypothetical protein
MYGAASGIYPNGGARVTSLMIASMKSGGVGPVAFRCANLAR